MTAASAGPGAVANVYCGTSDFAATVLGALAGSRHRPALVVTPPDRPRGRGRRLRSPPVAELARELGLALHQTPSINDDDSRRTVLGVGAEVAVVCAFGQLIKRPLIDALPLLNVHPSRLPRWRGAAPIERAIMAGDAATATSIMLLGEGLDDGPVALMEDLTIGAADTYGFLSERLAESSSRLLIEALDLQAQGRLEERFAPQEAAGVTYAEKLEPGERRIDPARPAPEEVLRVRALTPHIGAFAELAGGDRLGVRATATRADGPPPGEFGERAGELLLGCSPGALRVGEVQPPGGRWMNAADYLRGRGLPERAALGAGEG